MKEIARAQVVAAELPYRQDISVGRHTLIADEPAPAGGADAGPAPYELLLASLGSCTAITLQMYAQRKQWPLGRLRIDLQLFKNRDGETRIERRICSDAPLDETQWQRLLEIAEKTPVTLTLKSGASIDTWRE